MARKQKKKAKKRKAKHKAPAKIKIHCAFDKMIETGSLVPHPQNPNKHPDKQIEKLAVLIRFHGWRHPITISKRSGFIVSGHCRLAAAKALKLKTVPVDYQPFLNEAEEWAVMVSDNIVQEFSELDGQIMADGLVMLDEIDFPLDLTALDAEQIEDFIHGPQYVRPEFENLIEEFDPGTVGKSPKDGNWLYVEFYGQDEKFAKLKKALAEMLIGEHELDGGKFIAFVEKAKRVH